MRFTKSELEMIYKYEATTKEDTVKAMRDGQSAARDDLTRIIIRNAADCKLRSNGMPVPLLRNGYSIFNGTKYR